MVFPKWMGAAAPGLTGWSALDNGAMLARREGPHKRRALADSR
jgi:hypothetical protein